MRESKMFVNHKFLFGFRGKCCLIAKIIISIQADNKRESNSHYLYLNNPPPPLYNNDQLCD